MELRPQPWSWEGPGTVESEPASPAWPAGTTPTGPWPPSAAPPFATPQLVSTPVASQGQEVARKGALRRAWERFVAALAAVGALVAKFGALLVKLKYVTVVISMLVSIAAYTWLFGWTFAVGFVLLILVHEMGHVIVLRRQGIASSLPIFLPFLGAFVNMKGSPRSAYEEAQSGLAGPVFGVAASIVVAEWANATGSHFLMDLAFVGFFLNLFNLMPALPLDGGRAAAALHPVLWLFGLVGLLAFEIADPSPVIPVILVLGGYELWQRWTNRHSQAAITYYALSAQQRAVIGALYLFVVVVALIGIHATYSPLGF